MLKKAIRTAQNFFPGLAEAKNDFYYVSRRYLGTVHDGEFKALRALPRTGQDLFLDIGANRGQSILAMRHFRPDAPIISFEPNPLIFARLQRRFSGMAGVQLMNVGLGPQPGEPTLYVPSYNGFMYDGVATFSRDTALGYLSPDTLFFFDPAKIAVTEHACTMRTLDSFGLQPSFIKIDVEGFEYDVLAGGMDTLRRCRPTLMLERFYEDARLMPMLEGLGYQEVVVENDRLRPGRSEGLNMLLSMQSGPRG